MRGVKRMWLGWVMLTAVFVATQVEPAEARGFKVYGYKTPHQGEVELVYWVENFVKGNTQNYNSSFFGPGVDKDGLWTHTFEVEYGVTDRWTVAYYADFEQPSGEDFEYVQSRAVFLRYRLFEAGERFFDPAIYLEYYVPRKSYSKKEKLEARIILEKNVGPVQVKLNPILEKILSSSDVEEGLEFEYAMGVYLKGLKGITPGIEFYGEMGEIGSLKSLPDQEHFVFPAVKVALPYHMEFETGVGFGLTPHSDDLVVKGIFSFEYD